MLCEKGNKTSKVAINHAGITKIKEQDGYKQFSYSINKYENMNFGPESTWVIKM